MRSPAALLRMADCAAAADTEGSEAAPLGDAAFILRFKFSRPGKYIFKAHKPDMRHLWSEHSQPVSAINMSIPTLYRLLFIVTNESFNGTASQIYILVSMPHH